MMEFDAGSTLSTTGAEHAQSIGEGLLRIGAQPRAEIRGGLNSYDIKRTPFGTERGFEDVAIGAKVAAFTGEGLIPSISVLGVTTIETGGQSFRATSPEPKAERALSWKFSDRLSLPRTPTTRGSRATNVVTAKWASAVHSASVSLSMSDHM